MSKPETTAPPASESSLHRLFLDMKSDLMQHVQDCVLNSMQNFVRYEVSSDDLCDGHFNPRVSDEIDLFLAHNVGQGLGETLSEVSGDLKGFSAEFSTNERNGLVHR